MAQGRNEDGATHKRARIQGVEATVEFRGMTIPAAFMYTRKITLVEKQGNTAIVDIFNSLVDFDAGIAPINNFTMILPFEPSTPYLAVTDELMRLYPEGTIK